MKATKPHRLYPLVVVLPDPGNYPHIVRAEYVPNSNPPAYRLDPIGMDLPITVTIPKDLVAAGWYWHGSTLAWPASDPLRPMAISTATYPPPGWPAERENCFELARGTESRRAEWRERAVVERVAKATKTKLPKAGTPVAEAVQMELF